MKVLIIGGSRFIGRHLTEYLLNKGFEVVLFNRGGTNPEIFLGVERIQGDRKEFSSFKAKLRSYKFDYVVDMIPMNDLDTRQVVEVFKDNIEQSVHITSQDVYEAWDSVLSGKRSFPIPIDETYPLRERKYPYKGRLPGRGDYDKTLVEEELAAGREKFRFPYAVIRFPKTYGEFDAQYRFHEVVKSVRDKRTHILVSDNINWLWSDGYVKDMILGIEMAMTSPKAISETYNIGNAKTRTIQQTIIKIAELMGSIIEPVYVPDWILPQDKRSKSSYAQHLVTDTGKIRKDLGYKETYSLDQGFLNTIEWTLANPPEKYAEDFSYEEEDNLIKKYKEHMDKIR